MAMNSSMGDVARFSYSPSMYRVGLNVQLRQGFLEFWSFGVLNRIPPPTNVDQLFHGRCSSVLFDSPSMYRVRLDQSKRPAKPWVGGVLLSVTDDI
jgi:hypothetical protein